MLSAEGYANYSWIEEPDPNGALTTRIPLRPATPSDKGAVLLEMENIVQYSRSDGVWRDAHEGMRLELGDKVRTRQRSRAVIGLKGKYDIRIDQLTTIEIKENMLDLQDGASFLFSREKDGEIDIKVPAANAALRG
jgi:hypothetical protein